MDENQLLMDTHPLTAITYLLINEMSISIIMQISVTS